MSKFLDQRFYPYFSLNGYVSSGTQFSRQTPIKAVFSLYDQRYNDGAWTHYRYVDIVHCSGSGYGRHSTRLPLDPFRYIYQTPDIQNSSLEFQTSFYSSAPQDYYYSKFSLKFGDLSLPLTDEIITNLEDTSVKDYGVYIDLGDDKVLMTGFSDFASRRKIIRGDYTNPLSTRYKSFLMTTSQEEVGLPMTLYVSKHRSRLTIGDVEKDRFVFLFRPNLVPSGLYTEVKSTHEASSSWNDSRTWTYLNTGSGVPSPGGDLAWREPI